MWMENTTIHQCPGVPFHWLLIPLLTRIGVGGEGKATIILFNFFNDFLTWFVQSVVVENFFENSE